MIVPKVRPVPVGIHNYCFMLYVQCLFLMFFFSIIHSPLWCGDNSVLISFLLPLLLVFYSCFYSHYNNLYTLCHFRFRPLSQNQREQQTVNSSKPKFGGTSAGSRLSRKTWKEDGNYMIFHTVRE